MSSLHFQILISKDRIVFIYFLGIIFDIALSNKYWLLILTQSFTSYQ